MFCCVWDPCCSYVHPLAAHACHRSAGRHVLCPRLPLCHCLCLALCPCQHPCCCLVKGVRVLVRHHRPQPPCRCHRCCCHWGCCLRPPAHCCCCCCCCRGCFQHHPHCHRCRCCCCCWSHCHQTGKRPATLLWAAGVEERLGLCPAAADWASLRTSAITAKRQKVSAWRNYCSS